MTPAEYCEQKVRPRGSTFYYSSLFLPLEKREAVTSLHAYCREVGEVTDECHEPAVARIKLEWWRQEIDNTFRGKPTHPICKALVSTVHTYGMPKDHFLEFIDGVEMDLNQGRYNTFGELTSYCQRVGAVMGLLSTPILEYTDPTTLQCARELGIALQLTEILLDVRKHARRNHVYIPIEDLTRFDVPVADIMNGIETSNFRSLIAFEMERIEHHYACAIERLPKNDRLRQLPALIMAAIYRATLDEVRKDGYRILNHSIALTPVRKFWIAYKTRRQERRLNKRHVPGSVRVC
ncbi:MAG: presqualene diphosphate synthase HpnD [Acidiferrobacterales bacterium]